MTTAKGRGTVKGSVVTGGTQRRRPASRFAFRGAQVYVPRQPGVKMEMPARMPFQLRWDRPAHLDSEVKHEAREKAGVAVRVGSDFAYRRGFHGAFWGEFYL